MKSEQEIKTLIDKIEKELEEKTTYYHIHSLQAEAMLSDRRLLKWVLEDSEPKRTIRDLSEEELRQLSDILWLKYDDDCTVYEHILYFETLQKFAERLQQILSKPKGEVK